MQNISVDTGSQDKTAICICFTSCAECPYVARTCNYSEYICNHPKRVAFKPYCNDRLVDPHIIDSECPLLPQPVKLECRFELCMKKNGVCELCEAKS